MELCDIQIYDLYAASRRTVVVCAAIHAGFFEFLLKRGAAQAADLEVEFGWTRKGSDAMLVSLFAMDLLIKVDPGTGEWGEETYSPSQLTCNFLDRSKPFYIGDLFELEYKYFTNPSGLLEILKKPLNPENFFGMCQTTEDAAFFTKAMHSISSLPAFHAAQKFEWGTYKCVLDVGGGSGIYSISIVKQNPHMKAIVYDIEKVLPATKGYIASYNVEDQVMTASGDMFENEGKDYPRYFEKGDVKVAVDVIFHSQILHDWSVDLGMKILQNAYNILNPGGIVLINEKLLNEERSGPIAVANVSIDMLWMVDGQQYNFKKLSEMLLKIGFKEPHELKTVQYWSLVWATK